MPELPEVEVTRQSFAARIAGAQGHRGARRQAAALAARLRAARSWSAAASATSHGAASTCGCSSIDGGLLMHLGMSGSLAFATQAGAPGTHDHFDLVTTRGTLRLTDPRRFGAVVWAPAVHEGMAAKLLAGLGVEPFDAAFTGAHLHAAAAPAQGRDQERAGRRRHRRRRRQHLRLRGAVRGRHRPAHGVEPAEPPALRRARGGGAADARSAR